MIFNGWNYADKEASQVDKIKYCSNADCNYWNDNIFECVFDFKLNSSKETKCDKEINRFFRK